jgi:DNA adenine methylase
MHARKPTAKREALASPVDLNTNAAAQRLASVHKTIWGSPAGKKRLAERLAGLLPAHKTYVEPFAGSAAVLFAKEPSDVEVINDADPEIADAYRIIKRLKADEVARLRKMKWTGDEATFKRLFDAKPKGDLEKLHRFLYVAHFSYGRLRGRSFSPSGSGTEATTVDRVEKFGPRLAKVRIHSGDYERVVRKYDGKNTAFYLDPPYPGYNVDVGESDFDEARFLALLKSIKGKFLVTYGTRGELPARFEKEGFQVKRIKPSRTIGTMRGVGGPKVLTTLLVSNYDLVEKSFSDALGDEWLVAGDEHQTPIGEAPANNEVFAKNIQLIKGADPTDERYVLGIVLEPEVVDAQGDIYSAEEVRVAAHRFMEEFGGLGLMHRMRVNGQVKVLESYLAPVEFAVGETTVRQGTWLLAVRILSDELWADVKDGTLGGFSVGGTARREPDAGANPAAPSEQPTPSAPQPEAP